MKDARLETPKFNRAQKREIDRLNERLDSYLARYIKYRTILGNGPKLNQIWLQLDGDWKTYCNKYNRSTKNTIKADIHAFHRQMDGREKLEDEWAKQAAENKDLADFHAWEDKMELRFPRVLWGMKVINYFTKGDYVRKQFKKLQGNSPRGTWL